MSVRNRKSSADFIISKIALGLHAMRLKEDIEKIHQGSASAHSVSALDSRTSEWD